ncbi:MAG TPA: hypothetical protein VEM41_13200 [Actinomycetota bacterium]|nr:hypothetical protein [Actinomycetota bacterium]
MNTKTLPLVLVLLALTACAKAATPGAGGGGVTSTTVPPGSGGLVPAHPKIVTPSPGLVDVRPTAFSKATPSADGMTLTVDFWGSPCLGIDHVNVKEATSTVTVTLYQGTLPSTVGSACPDIAMLEAVVVQLSSPLGNRTVVDGALGDTESAPPSVGGTSAPGSTGSAGSSASPGLPAASAG